MKLRDLEDRVQQLITQSRKVLSTVRRTDFGDYVDTGKLAGLRASALSFITMVYGKNHSHYSEFDKATKSYEFNNASSGHEILIAILNEIQGGWIFSVKQLVSAEIFSDFLEMAEHLLNQGYKDPAAVMVGSVLEENLRQLCSNNGIDIETEKDGKLIPKKADLLNAELARAEVYTKLDQKAVTTWLDLRNKAAHGKYSEYTKEQVNLMQQGITEFLARVNY